MKHLILFLLTTSLAYSAADFQMMGAFSGQKGASPSFDYALLDNMTNATTVIDYSHSEVHSGNSYIVNISDDDIDTGDVLSLCFSTPNTKKWMHAFISMDTTVASTIAFYEGVSLAANTGTTVSAIAHNRNSTNTSGILNFATVPVSGYATKNGTITSTGTLLLSGYTSGTKSSPLAGSADHDDEFILKQNTSYCLSVTSAADNGVAAVKLEWYEHTSISR